MDRDLPQGNSDSLHVSFRLSAQRALLGNVSPSWRQVSIAVDELARRYWIRFVFANDVSDAELEDANDAAAELMGDFLDWEASEEFQKCDPPERPEPLDWIVYSRKEDSN